MRVGAQLSETLGGDYIVRVATRREIFIPRTLHKGVNNPVLCLINLSNHHVKLEKGVVLTYAEEVCLKVEPVGIQKVEIAEQEVQEEGEREIPEHLINLFEKSKEEQTGQEQGHLGELLCEFEDMFAKNEFDLGKFDAIKHGIDTGSILPVKHRIRRTPVCGGGRGPFKKNSGARVIQPSVSEWASASLLIRKRCGSVR
jgi:hypothetical protein